jgi:hypothetical protein
MTELDRKPRFTAAAIRQRGHQLQTRVDRFALER